MKSRREDGDYGGIRLYCLEIFAALVPLKVALAHGV